MPWNDGPQERNAGTAGPLRGDVQSGAGNKVRPHQHLIEIRTPVGSTRGPAYTESLLLSLHKALQQQDCVVLGLRSSQGTASLTAEVPPHLRSFFLHEFQDAYPGINVRPVREDEVPTEYIYALRLAPDIFRIRDYEQFYDTVDQRRFTDPLAGLLAALRTSPSGRLNCSLELLIRRPSDRWQRSVECIAERLKAGFYSRRMRKWYLRTTGSHRGFIRLLGRYIGKITRQYDQPQPESKVDEPVFECFLTIRIKTDVEKAAADQRSREISSALARFHGDAKFVAAPFALNRRRGFAMTSREIATIWHPLTASGDAVSQFQRSTFREIEPPEEVTLKKENFGDTVLGRVIFRQQRNQCRIQMDDLRRHLIAVGKTGCGKSTFLFNVVRQQMESGRGVVLIDPHGQLAEELLDVVPKRRTNDVIYFDASDRIAPVGFNPMNGPPGIDPNLLADGVLTSFKNVFGFDAGSAPRLLHIFRNCLLTLIGTPHASLRQVQRILTDTNFRKSAVAHVSNAAVREFWLTEFNRWNERDRTQYVASLQNKLGAFLTNERLQGILDSGQQGIQLRHIMDRSDILVCNLSKGTVGHDASTLLGSLLISSLQIAAMSRADVPESERTDCVIVVDEFHSYLAEGNTTMADALAESRKYRTSYVLSTQMLDGQLDSATLAGVLGNCGSTLCMTVGPRDAEILSGLLGSDLTPADLMQIPKYHGYLRLLSTGTPHTFSMTTVRPPRYMLRRAEIVRRVSRERFGRSSHNKQGLKQE